MENKEQDRALQTPSEANRDKHMNYLATEENANTQSSADEENYEDENDDQPSTENNRTKNDFDSSNSTSTSQMLQQENLIDPGNEHNHMRGRHSEEDENFSKKFNAEADNNATGSMGANPDEQSNMDKK